MVQLTGLFHGGNKPSEYFLRSLDSVLPEFDHQTREYTKRTPEPLGGHSVPTSVATSITSQVDYESPQGIADGSLLKGKKRATNDSHPLRKSRRWASPALDPKGCPQPVTQELYPESSVTIVSVQLINDTIRYLEKISSPLTDSRRGSSGGWASMEFTARVLQGKYTDILLTNKMNLEDLDQRQPGEMQALPQCPKCSAADEEKLYD